MNYRSIKIISMIGIVLMLLVLIGVGLYGFDQLNKLNEGRNSLKHTNAVMVNLQSVFAILKDAETGQRGFLITGDDRYLAPYKEASSQIDNYIEQLKRLTANNPNQSGDISSLENTVHKKFIELKETIEVRRSKGFNAARQIVLTDRGKAQMEKIRHTFAQMYQREYDLLGEHQLEQDLRARNSFVWLFFLCSVAILFQFAMGLITIKFLEREKKSTDKLREQAKLLDLSHDAVLVRDLDGTIRYWNRGAQAMYGYGGNEALGKSSHTLFDTQFPQTREEADDQLLKSGYWEAELTHQTKDGKRILVSSRQTLKLDTEGKPVGVLEINTDITVQKEAEQKQAALAEIKRINTELEQFTFMVSHDLQEPLRAIAGCLQILEKSHKDKLGKEAAELMHYAVDGALRMRTLITDLLALSRVHASEAVLERIDLEEVLKDAQKNLEVSMKESNAQITHDPLPIIKAEKTLLVQLFQNLISNAIKFSKDGPPKIHISAKKEDHHWQICISDNGIGFDSANSDTLFQPFKRLHGKDVYPGNGIGLAICKRIVERHSGNIWAKSEPGKGATFCFTILDFE